jgi:hypothetical protein
VTIHLRSSNAEKTFVAAEPSAAGLHMPPDIGLGLQYSFTPRLPGDIGDLGANACTPAGARQNRLEKVPIPHRSFEARHYLGGLRVAQSIVHLAYCKLILKLKKALFEFFFHFGRDSG